MQIGIAMSPLSNNALFLTYERNPLPTYFRYVFWCMAFFKTSLIEDILLQNRSQCQPEYG